MTSFHGNPYHYPPYYEDPTPMTPYQKYPSNHSVGFNPNNPTTIVNQHAHHAYHPPTPTQSSWQPNRAYNHNQETHFLPGEQNHASKQLQNENFRE